MNGTVKLTSKVMIKDAPLAGATVTCTVVRPDGTTQTVALLDDGAHNDGAARDGVYANAFVGSQYGVYSLSAVATGTAHEIPFLRTTFSEVQFGSGTAQISGAFSDRGVDTDGDGLYNTLQVDVPVQVATAGEYAAFAEMCIRDSIAAAPCLRKSHGIVVTFVTTATPDPCGKLLIGSVSRPHGSAGGR